jgi:hypothetical protein
VADGELSHHPVHGDGDVVSHLRLGDEYYEPLDSGDPVALFRDVLDLDVVLLSDLDRSCGLKAAAPERPSITPQQQLHLPTGN